MYVPYWSTATPFGILTSSKTRTPLKRFNDVQLKWNVLKSEEPKLDWVSFSKKPKASSPPIYLISAKLELSKITRQSSGHFLYSRITANKNMSTWTLSTRKPYLRGTYSLTAFVAPPILTIQISARQKSTSLQTHTSKFNASACDSQFIPAVVKYPTDADEVATYWIINDLCFPCLFLSNFILLDSVLFTSNFIDLVFGWPS